MERAVTTRSYTFKLLSKSFDFQDKKSYPRRVVFYYHHAMKNQLHPLAAGLTAGVFWGLAMMVGTWVAMKWEYGSEFLRIFENAYPGYEQTVAGSFIGLGIGFVDAFLGAYVIVWLYNFFVRKLSK